MGQSYSNNQTPMGFGGQYTEQQWRNQVQSAQFHANCIQNNSESYSAPSDLFHAASAARKLQVADNMMSKGINLSGNGGSA
jgi:hypothetical protein